MNTEELSRSPLPEAGSRAYPFCVSELWRWSFPLGHCPALTHGVHEVNVVHKVPLSQVDSELGRRGTRALVAVEEQNTGPHPEAYTHS